MAQVNVTINGRQFRMACEDGQEGHLTKLAKEFDDRIAGLRSQFGEVGDTRLTIMAALTIADEFAETARKLRQLEEEVAATRDARAVATDRAQTAQADIVAAFNAAAERIESITKKLNQSAVDKDVALS